jgi:glycosyltransferase involved in cell wall biosynthesis
MTEIDIALPCYNSAPWLDGMIESILAQDETSWRIVARDDGSADATEERLAAWQGRLGARMLVLDNPRHENLGIAGNYTAVLEATTAPWILTADPDATVIDERQNAIAPSFWRWVRSNPRRVRHLLEVAMENPALGSTMGINRALLDIALPIPRESGGQDWWFALTATAFGQLSAIEEVSILYRRHPGNHSNSPFGGSILDAFRRSMADPKIARGRIRQLLFNKIAPQATVFVERYGSRLQRRDAEGLRALANLRARGPIGRRISVLRHGLAFASAVKSFGMWMLC